MRAKDFGRMAASYSKAYQGGIGELLAGQSGCREQPISAHGRLERVLQAVPRSLPLARPKITRVARLCPRVLPQCPGGGGGLAAGP